MVPWQKVWNQVSRLLVSVTEMTERSFASLVYLDFFFFFFQYTRMKPVPRMRLTRLKSCQVIRQSVRLIHKGLFLINASFFLCIINSNSQMNYLSKVNFQKWRINDSTKKNLSLFLPALGSQNVSDTLFQYEVTICLITFFIFIFVPIKCLHRLKLVCLFIFMVSKHLNR